MSLNKAQLIGNVGRDPEIKAFGNGNRVAQFSLATSERWKDKETGEKREHTDWHRITVFSEGLVKVIEQYVRKGSKLYIEGQIKTREWEKDGEKRYSTEIVLNGYESKLTMLGGKGEGRQPPQPDDYGSQRQVESYTEDQSPAIDDEIPF